MVYFLSSGLFKNRLDKECIVLNLYNIVFKISNRKEMPMSLTVKVLEWMNRESGNISDRRVIPSKLNEKENVVIQTLLTAGVISLLKHHHFSNKEETMVVCCPDGSKIRYIFELLLLMYSARAKKRGIFFHTLTRLGGPICIWEKMPLDNCHRESLLKEIILSVAELGYRSCNLVLHFPCAMARKAKISPWQAMEALVEAKKNIKETVLLETGNHITVACHLHVGNGKLYFVSREKFETFKKDFPFYF